MKRFLTLFGLILGGAALAGLSDDAPSAPVVPAPLAEPTQVATVSNPQITELSGLAASRRYPGLLWAHNDSGDTARVFLLDLKGATVATVNLKGAEAHDYEDIAVAGRGARAKVIVGDIGDNNSRRDSVQLYRFSEPKLDPKKRGQILELKPETLDLRYPGGPCNAETLLAAPDGRAWILSKDEAGSTLFAAPKTLRDGQSATLSRASEVMHFGATGIFTKLATGGEFSPDGKRLAIVTYAQLYEWKLPAPYDVTKLSKLKPTVRALPPLQQCEAVCYSADGQQIFVSSEGETPPLWKFQRSP